MNEKCYWKGMCENCPFATEFQMKPWVYWFCSYYNCPMAGVKNCSGPKEKK